MDLTGPVRFCVRFSFFRNNLSHAQTTGDRNRANVNLNTALNVSAFGKEAIAHESNGVSCPVKRENDTEHPFGAKSI